MLQHHYVFYRDALGGRVPIGVDFHAWHKLQIYSCAEVIPGREEFTHYSTQLRNMIMHHFHNLLLVCH